MKKQHSILIILFSWLAGLACCNLLTCNNDTGSKEDNNNWKKIKQADKAYQQKADSLFMHAEELKQALSKTGKALAVAKSSNRQLKLALQEKIEQHVLLKERKDTNSLLTNCDSLQRETAHYIAINEQQDSLQENIQQNLHRQLGNKDSIIAIKDSQYQLAATAAIAYRGQMKKLRRRNKLKSIGIVLLSALSISSLLQH